MKFVIAITERVYSEIEWVDEVQILSIGKKGSCGCSPAPSLSFFFVRFLTGSSFHTHTGEYLSFGVDEGERCPHSGWKS